MFLTNATGHLIHINWLQKG